MAEQTFTIPTKWSDQIDAINSLSERKILQLLEKVCERLPFHTALFTSDEIQKLTMALQFDSISQTQQIIEACVDLIKQVSWWFINSNGCVKINFKINYLLDCLFPSATANFGWPSNCRAYFVTPVNINCATVDTSHEMRQPTIMCRKCRTWATIEIGAKCNTTAVCEWMFEIDVSSFWCSNFKISNL